MSHPVPADASTPLIDMWMAIIVLLFVLFAGVCAVIYRFHDQRRRWDNPDEPEPEDLLDDAENWRDR